MRVSDANQHASFQRNLNHNYTRMNKYHRQLSSFLEIEKSSDNPLAFSKILNMNDSIYRNEGYNTTINESIGWSNTQDAALKNATESMHRVRDLLLASANDTLGPDEMKANKQEMISEIDGIVDSLNTTYDGRYVFGGQNTTTPPFEVVKDSNGDITEIKYHGTDNNLPREISEGVTVELVTDGSKFMNETTDADGNVDNLNIFVQDLMLAMNNNDHAAISGTAATSDEPATGLIARWDNHLENMVDSRAKIGTTTNRLESAKDRNEAENLQLKEALSEKQDIDLAEKYMEWSTEMVAYQACLSVGTKIMQTSILDYI
ncbi:MULTISPECIES: flagellar hook-associated protein FlgL [Vagococcus]|uniref:Flagellar hook-associated protein FlgL n=1 Tax=Vagococcus fluvialis bH819 TaxID=1255619 RepID=A0A1X6WRF2_9ENTE|nr:MULTISPECIES: flagellar hook-associated protein FlgL [Vagococcus]SLM86913.1 Flagellar hook-associated protein FlgL [Vagococcus fluvialis bH819]HCM88630.1 flagellar hook-associated protein 3 [Vagococcus sp.]